MLQVNRDTKIGNIANVVNEKSPSFSGIVSSAAYCVIFKNKIVAVMVGAACFNNVIDIDIETEEEHRRKGLAYAMAVEFISDCL